MHEKYWNFGGTGAIWRALHPSYDFVCSAKRVRKRNSCCRCCGCGYVIVGVETIHIPTDMIRPSRFCILLSNVQIQQNNKAE